MNKKMLGAVLGTLAFGSMTLPAFAGEKPAAEDGAKAPAKASKGKKGDKKADADKKGGGEKSCGGEKGCGGKK